MDSKIVITVQYYKVISHRGQKRLRRGTGYGLVVGLLLVVLPSALLAQTRAAPSIRDMATRAPAGTESIDAYGIGPDVAQASQEARAGTLEEAILRIIGPDAMLTNWKRLVPVMQSADVFIVSENILRSIKGKDGLYTVKLRANVNTVKLQQQLISMNLMNASSQKPTSP